MNAQGWAEIAITLAITVALAWPLGLYLARVWQGERTWLDPVLRPVERVVYAGCGIKPDASQGWFAYAASFLAFSAASFVVEPSSTTASSVTCKRFRACAARRISAFSQ